MADDLVSKKTLKQYLEGIDVDTSNFDNDEIDLQYLDRLTKRDGSQLSNDEKTRGNIKLTQYLGDYSALQTKNEEIAQAENKARQDIAYNDYVNSKLAKYLNIAEENNGTAGYTGITQGNRIQLANQEKNIASQIEQNKQSTIKDYLNTYGNQLLANSSNALDQETSLQSALDTKAEKRASNIEYYAGQMISNYNPTSENGVDYYDTSARDAIANYINSANISDEAKKEIINNIEHQYNWKDYTAENIKTITNEAIKKINSYRPTKDDTDGKDYYGTNVLKEIENYINSTNLSDDNKKQILDDIKSKYNFKEINSIEKTGDSLGLTWYADVGDASLDSATNVAARLFKYKGEGGAEYKIKSADSYDTNGITNMFRDYSAKFSKMKNGEYAKFEKDGTLYIIYKRTNPYNTSAQYVLFKKNDTWNTGKRADGFDNLYKKAKDITSY